MSELRQVGCVYLFLVSLCSVTTQRDRNVSMEHDMHDLNWFLQPLGSGCMDVLVW